MTIYLNILKRALRDKSNLIYLILFPILLVPISIMINSFESGLEVAIVDYDNTNLSDIFIEEISKDYVLTEMDESNIELEIISGRIDGAIIIKEGFEESLIGKEPIPVDVIYLEHSSVGAFMDVKVDTILQAYYNIALSSDNEEGFYAGIELYNEGMYSSELEELDEEYVSTRIKGTQIGLLTMNMLLLAIQLPRILVNDRESKIINRISVGPITIPRYMVSSILALFTIAFFQVIVSFVAMEYIFKLGFGEAMIPMVVISLIFALVSIALGLAIMSFSKDRMHYNLIGTSIKFPFIMLGGCWWTRTMMPDFLISVSEFIPTTWVMKGYESIIYGASLSDVTTEILVLLAFGAVFLLMASWRRVDISKQV